MDNTNQGSGMLMDPAGNIRPATSGDMSISDAANFAVDEMDKSSPSPKEDKEETPEVIETSGKTEKAPATESPKDEPTDWDKVPAHYRKAFEDQKKNYDNLRSYSDRKATEWKQESERLKDLQTAQDRLNYFERIYQSNEKVRSVLDEALGNKGPQVDPTIQSDPLYQYIKNENEQLRGQLRPLMQWVQQEQTARQQRGYEDQVNAAEQAAIAEYKAAFGQDPGKEDMAHIFQYLADNKHTDGRAAVRAHFQEKIVQNAVQKALASQEAKKNISTKTSSVNSSKGVSNKKNMTMDDYFEMSMKELGIEFPN